ncbi:hypothetical protein ACL02S_09770 [Nocardia sp. 004]
MTTWIATFVLYVFVKPEATPQGPATLVDKFPAAAVTGPPGQ